MKTNFFLRKYLHDLCPLQGLRSPSLQRYPSLSLQRYPSLLVCVVFLCVSNGTAAVFGIYNTHTGADACDCTRGCTYTVRVSVLKAGSSKKQKENLVLCTVMGCMLHSTEIAHKRVCSYYVMIQPTGFQGLETVTCTALQGD